MAAERTAINNSPIGGALEKFLSYFLLLVFTFAAVNYVAGMQRFQGYSLAYQICEYGFGLCDNGLMIGGVAVAAAALFFMLKC